MKISEQLLSRDSFREAVFMRDNYKCVICLKPAKDAHHLIERRLFSSENEQEGYFLNNGASLCENCHILAETTELSVEEIRKCANITKVVLPDHLYKDYTYTKWGDIILNSGKRIPGELFNDESVRKILKIGGKLDLYTQYVKYPRSYHCPWSGYIGKDDKKTNDLSIFNDEIVMSIKMDGENTSLYNDYYHARSIDGNSHQTQSWARNFHSQIKHDIPKGWRLCCENLYAKHSIQYDNLKSYLYLFSIWNDSNVCLSWTETEEYAELFNIPVVPVIFKGIWREKPELIHKLWSDNYDPNKSEGYVIRSAHSFYYGQFKNKLMKYVRQNHVTSSSHWKFEKIETNKLSS